MVTKAMEILRLGPKDIYYHIMFCIYSCYCKLTNPFSMNNNLKVLLSMAVT